MRVEEKRGKGSGNRVGLARATVGMLGRLEWNVLSGRLAHQGVISLSSRSRWQ